MKTFESMSLKLCTLILCTTLSACGGDSDAINSDSPLADDSCVQTEATDCNPGNDPESGIPTADDPADPVIPPVDPDDDGTPTDPPADPPTDPPTPVSKCPNDPTNVDALFCHFNQYTNT